MINKLLSRILKLDLTEVGVATVWRRYVIFECSATTAGYIPLEEWSSRGVTSWVFIEKRHLVLVFSNSKYYDWFVLSTLSKWLEKYSIRLICNTDNSNDILKIGYDANDSIFSFNVPVNIENKPVTWFTRVQTASQLNSKYRPVVRSKSKLKYSKNYP